MPSASKAVALAIRRIGETFELRVSNLHVGAVPVGRTERIVARQTRRRDARNRRNAPYQLVVDRASQTLFVGEDSRRSAGLPFVAPAVRVPGAARCGRRVNMTIDRESIPRSNRMRRAKLLTRRPVPASSTSTRATSAAASVASGFENPVAAADGPPARRSPSTTLRREA